MNFLGIDVRTGGTRAVLVNQEGEPLSSSSVPHAPISMPQIGWAEQDPEEWWLAACEAIKQCLARLNIKPEEIDGIGLTGQMHRLVMLAE